MRPKINNNYILGACTLVMLALCLLSIWQPMSHQKEQQLREEAVKQRLLLIRQAEERYRQKNGTYAGSFATLTKGGWLADSLQYVPYAETPTPFSLSASTIVGKDGKPKPVMECGATYDTYLYGLPAEDIEQANEQANNAGLYPGLKIGDITTDNNNAVNW